MYQLVRNRPFLVSTHYHAPHLRVDDTEHPQDPYHLADWRTNNWPLKQVLEQFRSKTVEFKSTLQLALVAIVELHRSVELMSKSDETVVKILDHLAEHNDGLLAIESLHRAIPKIFAVNPIGKDIAEARLSHWLASYQAHGQIIVKP
jgi:hypothetical protein